MGLLRCPSPAAQTSWSIYARDITAALVDIARLPGLRGIRRDNGHLVIGGGTTISELLAIR